MSKPVPRSRLNITYRTRIDGVPVKQKLPMRFLVLGDFSGRREDTLEEREIQSIKPGMSIDSFMNEMKVMAPIDASSLATVMAGQLEGQITGKVKKELDGDKAIIKWSGSGTVTGDGKDNGMGSFSGAVRIAGEAETPLRNEVLTLSPTKMRVAGTVEGDITGLVEGEFELAFDKDKTSADDITATVTATVPVQLTIALRKMAAFTPTHIASSVPEIRRVLLLRRLLLELRADISGYSELREALKESLPKPDEKVADTPLGQLQSWIRSEYPMFQLDPAKAEASDGGGGSGGGGGGGSARSGGSGGSGGSARSGGGSSGGGGGGGAAGGGGGAAGGGGGGGAG